MKRVRWISLGLCLAAWVAGCSTSDDSASSNGADPGAGEIPPSATAQLSGADSGTSAEGDGNTPVVDPPVGADGGASLSDGGKIPGSDGGISKDGGSPVVPPLDAGAAKPDAGTTKPDAGIILTLDDFRKQNLAIVNQYRASKGIAALTLDGTLNTFAQAGSVELSTDHVAHKHFNSAITAGTLFSSGFKTSAGENQGDPNGWPVLDANASTNESKQIAAIQLVMFNEGPTGGHYQNMMNTKFKRLGVGLLEVGNKLYLTNDFSD